MRALIRNDEVMTEDTWSEWVRSNIPFLTGTEVDSEGQPMKGDGWTLVEDYHPQEGVQNGPGDDSVVTEVSEVEDAPVARSVSEDAGTQSPSVITEGDPEAPVSTEETVTYGGRTYTLDELRKLIG